MHSGALARDTDGVNDIPTETVTGSATTATVAPIRGDVAADSDPVVQLPAARRLAEVGPQATSGRIKGNNHGNASCA